MKTCVKSVLFCVLSVVIMSATVAFPAFAYEDPDQAIKDEMESTEEWQEHEELGKQINERMGNLPQSIGEKDREEVESIRKAYDEWIKEEERIRAKYGLNYNRVTVFDFGNTKDLERAEKILNSPPVRASANQSRSSTSQSTANQNGNQLDQSPIWVLVLISLWSILYIVQALIAYGTAYRKAKENGDNGVSLFGWLIVYNLAAAIPFLGIYLLRKSKAS